MLGAASTPSTWPLKRFRGNALPPDQNEDYPPNNSLQRTQPQRGLLYDVAVLRRSARGR